MKPWRERSGVYWVMAGALAVAAGAGLAIWNSPETVDLPLPVTPGANAPGNTAPEAPTPAPPLLAQTPVTADAPPPGVSAEVWRGLQSELSGRPEELRRLADYFVYADQLQRFRALPATASADRRALAQALDNGLAPRLRLRELSAAEARWIKIAVLDVLVDGDEQRQAALLAWESSAAVAAVGPAVDSARSAARNAEFQRRQAQIVAAWSATPPAQRDARALERDLDALRRSSFTAPR